MTLANKRICVTGGAGFLGTAVCRHLQSYQPASIFVPRSRDYDLRSRPDVASLFHDHQPEIVFHLAAVCGGIGANQLEPGRFCYENLLMGANVIEACRLFGVAKLVLLGTVCSYPKHATTPFRESDLWNGYPEETNAPYGLAKKMLMVMADSYRQQYGLNTVTLLPANLYGPGDHFDPVTSHVIPALIRRFCEAKTETITLWGSGYASREFVFVEDAADGICRAADKYDGREPVNLGSGKEIRILELASQIAKLCEYGGRIEWDKSKPDGQPRRCLDTSRALQEFGWRAGTKLEDGLRQTIAWYRKNFAN